MYEVTQKLQFYTFFYPLNVLIPSSYSQQCNGLTIFWLAEKTRQKTPIKRSKIKLLYLLAPSLFLFNRAKCSACENKFPTCCLGGLCLFGRFFGSRKSNFPLRHRGLRISQFS
jgi:hypothetical protein